MSMFLLFFRASRWLLCACLCCLPLRFADAADMNKVLRVAWRAAETGFDPAQVSDVFSNDIIRAIMDPLLTYDYLARPAQLVPNVIEGMPEVSENATRFRFKIRPGIYFADDPVFGGKKRELVAADYVFSLKRILDPALRSPNLYMFDGKFLGAREVLAQASRNGKFDYDMPMAGLQAPERYTLTIKLTKPDHKFLFFLASVNTGAVAREVAQAYSMQEMMAHPVGTGPYVLKNWVRGSKIVLEANPAYRQHVFQAQPGDSELDRQIMRHMQGKKLPQIGRIEVSVMDEAQPRWLAFLAGDLDYVVVPPDFIPHAIPNGKLPPDLARRGVVHQSEVAPGTFYGFFNLDDAVVGGYSKEKIALRRAIILGYRIAEDITQIHNGQALAAQGPISPGVAGYDAALRSGANHDPALARALLDHYGYKDINGDGYRELPDGKPLVIEKCSTPSSQDQLQDEIWKRSMDAIGIKLVFNKQKWPDLVKSARLGKVQMWNIGWAAQIPDGDSYLQLMYGPNKGGNNLSRFDLPAYNQRYQLADQMPPGAERDRLYKEMAWLALGYGVWQMGVHRIDNHLLHPWLRGYKIHPFLTNDWKYMDIDLASKKSALK